MQWLRDTDSVSYTHLLDELAKAPRPVRIAYFGDSFIEADILTADLREMLQQKYGGCGVGFVDVYKRQSIERFHATHKKFFEDIKKYPKASPFMYINTNIM